MIYNFMNLELQSEFVMRHFLATLTCGYVGDT